MRKCFVIMPFGGDNIDRRKHFLGVYNQIIVPAAERIVDSVSRADLSPEPGNITRDIIKKLAEADVVVADLTDANPNVFFELGIRHVMRKSGTVHIADRRAHLPFDVQAYRVVQYSTELAEIDAAVDEIALAIKRRLEQLDRSDNPVHDTFPGLPINYFAATSEALRADLETMQGTIVQLTRERDTLVERVRRIDATFGLGDDDAMSLPDVAALLSEADEALKQSGKYTLLRLAKAAEEEGQEGFVRELREALNNPYLTENDFDEIQRRCGRLGLSEHRRAVLMLAVARYPSNVDFRMALTRVSLRSDNVNVRNQGRVLAEQILNLSHSADDRIIMNGPPIISNCSDIIGILSDYYSDQAKGQWIVDMCEGAIREIGEDSIILRNMARALAHQKKFDLAEQAFRRAISLDPGDDTAVSFYASFLDDLGRLNEAYEFYERAVLLDPSDPTRWFSLAIQVLTRGLIPGEADHTFRGPIPMSERRRIAVPLIAAGVEEVDTGLRPSTLQRAVRLLIRVDAAKEAQALASGHPLPGDYDLRLVERVHRLLARSRTPSRRLTPPEHELPAGPLETRSPREVHAQASMDDYAPAEIALESTYLLTDRSED